MMVKRSLRSLLFCLLFVMSLGLCLLTAPGLANPPLSGSSLTVSSPIISAAALDQQGRSRYVAGDYAEAAALFLEAAQQYQSEGSQLKQALALSNRALACRQQGNWAEANQAIAASLSLLDPTQREQADRSALAQVLDIQGNLQLAQGQAESAVDRWRQAADLYEQLHNSERATAARINQAQALQSLGFYRRAITTLLEALKLEPDAITAPEALRPLESRPDIPTTIAALQSLGEALRVVGELSASRVVLQQSLELAQQSSHPDLVATTQFRLANLTRTEALVKLNRANLTPAMAVALVNASQAGDRRRGIRDAEAFYTALNQAIDLYRQAIHPVTSIYTQALLNQLRVLIEQERWSDAEALLPQIQPHLTRLSLSRTTVYAHINLAQSLMKLLSRTSAIPSGSSIPAADAASSFDTMATQLLTTALQQARDLDDRRGESYALGNLGRLYEQTQQLTVAQRYTQQALLIAQSIQASDLAYRWQWQLGRLLQAQIPTAEHSQTAYEPAIAAYREALHSLQSIRADLVAITPEEQFSFRDTVEPIHRQLVELLLNSNQATPSPSHLNIARDVIESLQLAELNDFFREACLKGTTIAVDQLDPQAAVFYPILLPDRLAVIVSLPPSPADGTAAPAAQLTSFTIPVAQPEIEATVNRLKDSLNQANDNRFLQPAQQLYDWLIRPIAAQLQTHHVKTLVFVMDGVLRDVPIAVLHDGQHYLVEQPYSIAFTPGLQLLENQALAPEPIRSALLAGITQARPGFAALPQVKDELLKIQQAIPRTITLLDSAPLTPNQPLAVDGEFTRENFRTILESVSFPIVHLATHGQFSSQIDETFILTEDSRLSIAELRQLLQDATMRQANPLDLLVFSACETAAGDKWAILGLAGMAVRAGARSTVATLWQVNDHSSALFMGQFYKALTHSHTRSKAEALHQAQQQLLQQPNYQHPYFWAPYILVGDWR